MITKRIFSAAPRFSVDGVLTVTGQGTIITGLTTKYVLEYTKFSPHYLCYPPGKTSLFKFK